MPMQTWREHCWSGVPVMRSRIEEIVRLVDGRGKTVLEIGCNEGFLSKALMEDGCLVTSADINENQIRKAKENFDIDALKADITKLPFEDGSFDIAVSGETLEHVQRPFVALDELFRVAREKVVISIPVGEYWLGELEHVWELNGSFVDHDSGNFIRMDKNLLVLSWTRRRDGSWKDIPPFDTGALKQKYGIR